MSYLDPFSYRTLGMFEDEFYCAVDSLYYKSLRSPVDREEVLSLLRQYCVEFSDLSTELRGKIGDIVVKD